VPVLVLTASFLGFGALVKESGLALWHGVFSTATAWALPGQIALIELHAVGAPLLAIVAAVLAFAVVMAIDALGRRVGHHTTQDEVDELTAD